MMRNVITIPSGNGYHLIIASDNSGAIGLKKHDHVQVSYEMVAYYSFRVAAMECMAAGGNIKAVVLNNFCGDDSWEALVRGIRKGLSELGVKDAEITGSTESNFSLLQSAIGVIVMGEGTKSNASVGEFTNEKKLAVIGQPLVGDEVIALENQVAPLHMFKEISRLQDVVTWPVGSKGILHELKRMYPNSDFNKETAVIDLDMEKSSGPATCFIVRYPADQESAVTQFAGGHFHSLKIQK
ncbi:ATP-binding protein [Neobacillus sp. LXY-1]|uniref:ATP-binding protein n=1 Tax=Neobacillus sp. LXY-1 TaxID=3379133 RepID=UPI003EDE8A80